MAGGLVIVGASLAGLRAAEAARRAGFEGRVTIIGDESHLPYDRPPLSKGYLIDSPDPAFFVTPEELEEQRIELMLSTRVTSLDPQEQAVLADGERIEYDTLVIATGASPRLLPGIASSEGIVTLRTLDDASEIRRRLTSGRNVVIVGAGFIGSEIASSAKSAGASVTILEAAPVPLVRAVGEIVGDAISRLHDRNEVRLIRGARIQEVVSVGGHVSEVVLDGGERLPADILIVGIGAAPTTGWLEGSGILLSELDGGVICDEFLRTSLQNVYAAGDVAHWPNAALGGVIMRMENWTNAADQGARAGANAVRPDAQVAFETVPYFWSDWYGHRIQFVGTANAETVEFISGDPDTNRFVALYRNGDRLVGAATLNEGRRIMKLRRVIQEGGSWQAALDVVAQGAPARSAG